MFCLRRMRNDVYDFCMDGSTGWNGDGFTIMHNRCPVLEILRAKHAIFCVTTDSEMNS